MAPSSYALPLANGPARPYAAKPKPSQSPPSPKLAERVAEVLGPLGSRTELAAVVLCAAATIFTAAAQPLCVTVLRLDCVRLRPKSPRPQIAERAQSFTRWQRRVEWRHGYSIFGHHDRQFISANGDLEP